METLRTPDERFVDLPDFAFEPHYAEIANGDGGTLRVHYLDEGPADAAPVMLLHGEPSWSFLYRHIVPPLVAEDCAEFLEPGLAAARFAAGLRARLVVEP